MPPIVLLAAFIYVVRSGLELLAWFMAAVVALYKILATGGSK